MENRVTELESKLAFQEDTIEKLNTEVIAQQKQIDYLLLEINALKEQMRRSAIEGPATETDERPPHY